MFWAQVRAKIVGGGEERVVWRPFRQASRWPKEVASALGGLWRTMVAVRREMEER